MIPADAELTDRPDGDPGVGRHARRPQAGAGPPDGGLRRVPRAHRPPHRPAHRRPRRPRAARRHADLLHHRRQRRVRRRQPERLLQRAHRPQRRRRPGDGRVHGVADRRLRHPGGLQPLRRRLGPRHGHAVPVDQAGRLALGRHPQRHHRPLAERHRRQGRHPPAVPPRHRRRPDHPRRRRPAGTRSTVNGVAQMPLHGVEHAADASPTAPTPGAARRRSTSRCSATAASTTRAGPP